MIKVILDNAQNTSHIDVIDKKGIICCQISFCSDGFLINGKTLKEYPQQDNIVICKVKEDK